MLSLTRPAATSVSWRKYPKGCSWIRSSSVIGDRPRRALAHVSDLDSALDGLRESRVDVDRVPEHVQERPRSSAAT